ncbi:proton-conducting transporter membrane subunit [Pseudobacteriovorax antillogorgiicola]|uniref:Multisubunit sodium/proton antiporter, MrpD subunit n=1 Tax=Pseudobacteriovorax antillogorgiicola TaxID=1513793 RepID=A0A1Y6CPU5_9BACT|nr:proton-conducting transporter membrane subunit [Pseudobacteriovorax antillogorgiicola]TCS43506.1 multisubunit sodium/proton antiporter MrpD subunit [Pseudobacteriovorax antillogorgiicola]SMF81121.1 multisubunit sodium/proton antiporter, MrpD subunit [Pseudobacteriovorax antillogorgiicola]
MSSLIFLPILIPFLGFCITLTFFRNQVAQKYLSLLIAVAHFSVALLLTSSDGLFSMTMGGWEAPFGISIELDLLSRILILVTSLIYLAVILYCKPGDNGETSPLLFPLLNIIVCGISGAFSTADLFNLYVWFEVTLLSSFVLSTLEGDGQRYAGALKYIIINILSSLIFLLAAGLIYHGTHTLNFGDLQSRLAAMAISEPWYTTMLSLTLFTAFAIKSALFPFHSWLPASYHHLSPTVSAIFGGLLTKVGLYAIFRITLSVFPYQSYVTDILAWLAGITMLVGVMGAVAQTHVRRILSFHIMSQVGYIAMAGVLINSPDATVRVAGFTAAIFYMVHHIIVKTNLFLVSGLIRSCLGSERLKELGGLRHSSPLIAILFAIPALSLAGLPPSSGFWAKFLLIKASLSAELYIPVLIMIIAGFFTLFSMTKIWLGAFWEPLEEPRPAQKLSWSPVLACLILGVASLSLAFHPDYILDRAKAAAVSLQERGAS